MAREDDERHEAQAEAERQVEAEVVRRAEATEEEVRARGECASEPAHRRRRQEAVPERALGAPRSVALLHQPAASHGNRDQQRQPHRDDERRAHEAVTECRRMLAEEIAHAAEHGRPHAAAPETLNSVKRARLIEDSPAIGEMSMRAKGMKRPTSTAAAPWRSKKLRVRASTAGSRASSAARRSRRPGDRSRTPPCCPPTPTPWRRGTAATSESRPCAAKAAAVTRVVSVGKGIASPSTGDEQRDDQVPIVGDEPSDVLGHATWRRARSFVVATKRSRAASTATSESASHTAPAANPPMTSVK